MFYKAGNPSDVHCRLYRKLIHYLPADRWLRGRWGGQPQPRGFLGSDHPCSTGVLGLSGTAGAARQRPSLCHQHCVSRASAQTGTETLMSTASSYSCSHPTSTSDGNPWSSPPQPRHGVPGLALLAARALQRCWPSWRGQQSPGASPGLGFALRGQVL